MKTQDKPYDIEDRLVRFAGEVILFTKNLASDDAGRYFRDQLSRSASASALNYGETQGAGSTKDTNHKLAMVLKELKETRVSLKITNYLKIGNTDSRSLLLAEVEELVAIIATIKKNKSQGQ